MSRTTVRRLVSDLPVPLYRDNDEHNAYISLDESGVLTAEENHLGRARTMDQWHSRELTWRLGSNLTLGQINDLLDEIAPLAQRVHDGHSVEGDGSNHVGRLTDDAVAASEEIEACCLAYAERAEGNVVTDMWDVGGWEAPDGIESMSDDDLDRLVEEGLETLQINLDGVVYITGRVERQYREWLEQQRAYARFESEGAR